MDYLVELILAWLPLLLLFGLIPALIARKRGVPQFGWWWFAGTAAWPIAMILVFFAERDPARVCPHCHGTVNANASTCQNCGKDLPARSAVRAPAWTAAARTTSSYDDVPLGRALVVLVGVVAVAGAAAWYLIP